MARKSEIGLVDLIDKIKHELVVQRQDTDLFFVEEINLEINFVISGDINSGFNVGIVTLGSNVAEQRVQKINVKLTPILSKEEIRKKLTSEDIKKISESSTESLFKSGSRVK
jgi:NTP-dependent ternary system trypsin peptidase co-occuring protein